MKKSKLILIVCLILFSLIGLIIFIIYNSIHVIPDTPKHPSSIPQEAFWVGGIDGGVFIISQKRKNDGLGIYYAEIYFETGTLAYKGRLALMPKKEELIDYKNKTIYSGWDGDSLHLIDGRFLKAID